MNADGIGHRWFVDVLASHKRSVAEMVNHPGLKHPVIYIMAPPAQHEQGLQGHIQEQRLCLAMTRTLYKKHNLCLIQQSYIRGSISLQFLFVVWNNHNKHI